MLNLSKEYINCLAARHFVNGERRLNHVTDIVTSKLGGRILLQRDWVRTGSWYRRGPVPPAYLFLLPLAVVFQFAGWSSFSNRDINIRDVNGVWSLTSLASIGDSQGNHLLACYHDIEKDEQQIEMVSEFFCLGTRT